MMFDSGNFLYIFCNRIFKHAKAFNTNNDLWQRKMSSIVTNGKGSERRKSLHQKSKKEHQKSKIQNIESQIKLSMF